MSENKGLMRNVDAILTTKESVAKLAEYMLDDEVSDLDKLMDMSKLKTVVKIVDELYKLKAVKEAIGEAVESLTEDGKQPIHTDFGQTITCATTYTKYVYTKCEHPVLDLFTTIEELLKSDIKVIKKELNTIPQYGTREIVLRPAALMEVFESIIIAVQDVMDALAESDGIIEVNAPLKLQTRGLKLERSKI